MNRNILSLLMLCIGFYQIQPVGAQQTQKAIRFGGNKGDKGNVITVDRTNNVVVLGEFQDTVDFDPGTGIYNMSSADGYLDGFVTKFDATGNFIWAKKIGGHQIQHLSDIEVNKNNQLLICGFYTDTTDFDPDSGVTNLIPGWTVLANGFILKLDEFGHLVWVKNIVGSMHSNCKVENISTNDSGYIYISGTFTGSFDFDPGPSTNSLTSYNGISLFIAKYDSSGNFIWARSVSCSNDLNHPSLAVDIFGNVYTAGNFNGGLNFVSGYGMTSLSSISDAFITKYSSSGNLIWVKRVGGSLTGSSCMASSLQIDATGMAYLTGDFKGTIDFDPGSAVYNLSADQYYYDSFTLKLDSSGNFIRVLTFGSSGYDDRCLSSELVSAKELYLIGKFQSTVDFDPGSGVFNMTTTGGVLDDIFILKLDTAGSFMWAKKMGGKWVDDGIDVAVDSSGRIFAVGCFIDTADFNPPMAMNLISRGETDAFIAIITQMGVGVSATTYTLPINVYPVPSKGKFVIETGLGAVMAEISIANLTGQTIYHSICKNANHIEINVDEKKGVYIGKLISENRVGYFKVIIE